MNWYWGDLHCHTNLSYGKGTIERALEIAKTHLDFCSITGHAYWPDMPTDLQHYDAAIAMHLGGFAKCKMYWPRYLELTQQYNTKDFITFPSYEWHSNQYGDYVVLSQSDALELAGPNHLHEFDGILSHDQHMMIPHHIGYARDHRGIDWQSFCRNKFTSSIEIYSNHGCAISDSAAYDYYHVMGPRDSKNTIDYALARGIECGFVGSTDSHDGFPGHYSHGRIGVLAQTKTRESIWRAIKNRRTVAATGAKINAYFQVNDAGIGETSLASTEQRIQYRLQGNQPFRYVEIIKNGEIFHHASGQYASNKSDDNTYMIKIEWGWGDKDQVVNWDNSLRVNGGEIISVEPCFRHTAFDTSVNTSPHQINDIRRETIYWISCTRGVPDSFVHNPETMTSGVNSLVLKVCGPDTSRIEFKSNHLHAATTLGQLRASCLVKHTAGPCSPAIRLGRAHSAAACEVKGDLLDTFESKDNCYYLTGQQIDGESIWVSPIWVK